MTRGRPFRPLLLCCAVLAVSAVATGCGEPPPDTSPAVRITSPTDNQTVKAGMPITVTFTIGGIDNSTNMMLPFMLDPISIGQKIPGKGRVVAYFNGTNIVAVASNPSDLSLQVPDPMYGSAKDIVTTGQGMLSLYVQYNDGSFVTPQRHSEVTVIVQ